MTSHELVDPQPTKIFRVERGWRGDLGDVLCFEGEDYSLCIAKHDYLALRRIVDTVDFSSRIWRGHDTVIRSYPKLISMLVEVGKKGDDDEFRVTSLTLKHADACRSPIPPSIFDLDHLTSLSFERVGEISCHPLLPLGLPKLKNLRKLSFVNSFFELPRDIEWMEALEEVRVSFHRQSRFHVPTHYVRGHHLKSLKPLAVTKKRFGNLRIVEVDLRDVARIELPEELGLLPLTTFRCRFFRNGYHSDSIAGLKDLQHLDMGKEEANVDFEPFVSNQKSLVTFTGPLSLVWAIPIEEQSCKLRELKAFCVTETDEPVAERVVRSLAHICNAASLTSLDLTFQKEQYSAEVCFPPGWFFSLRNLRRLRINIGEFTEARGVDLEDWGVTLNTFEIGALENLEVAEFDCCHFEWTPIVSPQTGALFPGTSSLPSLKRLHLGTTRGDELCLLTRIDLPSLTTFELVESHLFIDTRSELNDMLSNWISKSPFISNVTMRELSECLEPLTSQLICWMPAHDPWTYTIDDNLGLEFMDDLLTSLLKNFPNLTCVGFGPSSTAYEPCICMGGTTGRILDTKGGKRAPASLWPYLLERSVKVFETHVYSDLDPMDTQDEFYESTKRVTEVDAIYTLLRLGVYEIAQL